MPNKSEWEDKGKLLLEAIVELMKAITAVIAPAVILYKQIMAFVSKIKQIFTGRK